MNADQIITDIIQREGSTYTNRPHDRGGPTKFGITQAALAEYRGHSVTLEDVEALTEGEARAIYRQNYILKPHFNQLIDDQLAALMVDSGVLHGVSRATKWLQTALGVAQDGVLGTISLRAANSQPPARLYKEVLQARIKSIGALITSDPTQAENAAGWLNRAALFIV